MSFTGTVSSTVVIAGTSFNTKIQRTADGNINLQPTLPAAKTGSLSTRTSDTAGEITGQVAHGITTGATVDIYWSGGSRYGCEVGTVSTLAIPITASGTGDAFPDQDTDVTITTQTQVDTDFDGDNVKMIVVSSDQKGSVDMEDSASATINRVELAGSDEPWSWSYDTGVTNPMTGNPIDDMFCSNGSTTASTLKISLIYDSTP